MQSDVAQAVADLIKSGNANNEPASLTVGAIPQTDLYQLFKSYFSDKAQKTLDNRSQHLIYQYNEPADPKNRLAYLLGNLGIKSAIGHGYQWIRKYDKVYFFGSRCGKDQIVDAVDKVISAVNLVAGLDFTKAALLPLSVIQICTYNENGHGYHTTGDFVVLSYVTLTEDGVKYVKTNLPNMLFEEGGVPARVEDQ